MHNPPDKVRSILAYLALGYLALFSYGSLLPLEFRTFSWQDIATGLRNMGTQQTLFSWTDRVTNIALAIPFAFFGFGAAASARRPLQNVAAAVLICLFSVTIGTILEVMQILLPTRTAQWSDVVAQGIGAWLGIALWILVGGLILKFLGWRESRDVELGAQQCRQSVVVVVAIPYLIALLAMNGWLTGRWLSLAEGIGKAQELHLAPLYYAYTASIGRVVASVLLNLLLYAPIGLAFWLWPRKQLKILCARDIVLVASISGLVAAVVEFGKLFLYGKHPDSTNVCIAALAATTSLLLMSRIGSHRAALPTPAFTSANHDAAAIKVQSPGHPLRFIGLRLAAVAVFTVTVGGALSFPVGSTWLFMAVGLYTALLWKHPSAWLLVIPALLPTFDFAPWTGRFFLNEFDLFVFATIGTGLWISAAHVPRVRISKRFALLLTAFVASAGLSLLIGLLPLPAADFNAFSNYYSRYNALRAGKGLLEALALMPLLLINMSTGVNVLKSFSSGMVAGLAGVVVTALWERAIFPGLFNFSSDFRISALFSSMHTGGSHVEAYLVATLPFLVAWAYHSRSVAVRGGALVLFTLGAYALFVTFSRGGYVAFMLSIAVLLFGSMATSEARRANGHRGFFVVVGVALIASVLTAAPIITGSFAEARLAHVDADLAARFEHWRNVVNVVDPGFEASTFGMGLGRFPETYFFRNTAGDLPATYSFIKEGDNVYIRLGSGKPAYVEQVVRIQPHATYRLAVDLRSNPAMGGLNLLVCERTFFKSLNCKGGSITQPGPQTIWSHHELSFNSGALGTGPWFARRTVKLVLENTAHGSVLDVDNVHLMDVNDRELIANGDFSQGNDRWFYSEFLDHWPWHIENIWVQLLFEQGWFGLITFTLLVCYGLASMLTAARQGGVIFIVLLASISGFLAVGLFGSPLETPRLELWFYLTLFTGTLIATSKNATEINAGPTRTLVEDAAFAGLPENMHARNIQPSSAEADQPIDGPGERTHVRTDNSKNMGSDVTHISRALLQMLAGMATLVVSSWLIMHSAAVPYNVRLLLHPVHPLASLVVFSITIYWSFGFPVVVAYWLTTPGSKKWLYPVAVLLHSLVGWILLIYSVSFDRIHKIVGYPVLGWSWHWEAFARFVVLYCVLSLSFTVGTLIAVSVTFKRKAGSAILFWLVTTAALSPLLYWVVVTKAATDNIVELLADGGSVMSCVLISSFMALIAFGGSVLVTQSNAMSRRLRFGVLLSVATTIPLAYLALSYGTESALVKYGKVFSALQFILSPDREHYVQGPELILRYVLLHLGALGAIVLVQHPICAGLFKRCPVSTPRQT